MLTLVSVTSTCMGGAACAYASAVASVDAHRSRPAWIAPHEHARCPASANARCRSRCRVGDDKDNIHVTFRQDDDSSAPGGTPAPGGARPQGPQAAPTAGAAARVANGFPVPIEDVSGQDFWGRPGRVAPSAEDVVQIPIVGNPAKVCSTTNAQAQ